MEIINFQKTGEGTVEERRRRRPLLQVEKLEGSRCEPILTKTLEWEHLLTVEPLRASNNALSAKLSVVRATPSLSLVPIERFSNPISGRESENPASDLLAAVLNAAFRRLAEV